MDSTCSDSPLLLADQRRFVMNRIFLIAVCLATLIAPFVWNVTVGDNGPILCYVRRITGLPCPGCGMTRAFCALSKGLPGEALRHNLLAYPLLLLLTIAPPVAAFELWRGQQCNWYRFLGSRRLAILAAVGVCLYHITRLIIWAQDGTLHADFASGWLYRSLH